MNKQQYYQKVFEFMPDTIKNLIKNGVDSQANYIDSPTHYIEMNKQYWK